MFTDRETDGWTDLTYHYIPRTVSRGMKILGHPQCETEQVSKVLCISIRQSQRHKAKITGPCNIGQGQMWVGH